MRAALLLGLVGLGMGLGMGAGSGLGPARAEESPRSAAELMDVLMWNREPVGGPFQLVDHQGRTRTEADFRGKLLVVYFGYTSCPDVCPLDMLRNADAAALLDARGIDARPVFVTVDPARDTPAVVAGFAGHFAPDAVGLTGTPEQVAEAQRAWRVYARLGEGWETGSGYLVDHSAFTYLALPGVGFVDVARRDEAPEAVAERLACFVRAA